MPSLLHASTTPTAPVSGAFTPAVVAAIEQLRLRARSLASSGHQGKRRTLARGRSLEFADYRHYAPGDDPRDLDWNAVARFDALLIRLFHAEVALPLKICVDASPSMHWGEGVTKFVAALRLAAALTLIGASNETPVEIHIADGTPHARPLSLQRRAAFAGMLHRLDDVAGSEKRGDRLSLALKLGGFVGDRGSQTVVVLTDGYEPEPLLKGIGVLRAAGAEVDVLQVMHPEELSPRMAGDFSLEDSETGEQVRITVDEGAAQDYIRRVTRFVAGWRMNCRRRGAGHELVRSDMALAAALARVVGAAK